MVLYFRDRNRILFNAIHTEMALRVIENACGGMHSVRGAHPMVWKRQNIYGIRENRCGEEPVKYVKKRIHMSENNLCQLWACQNVMDDLADSWRCTLWVLV